MGAAVILGSWRLRHDEPGPAEVLVHPIDADLDTEAASYLIDLREQGVENLVPDGGPLALARIDGNAIELVALTTRQDRHRTHLLRPGSLPSCTRETLGPVLRETYQRWHLHLNNFECCVFPDRDMAASARHFTIDAEHVVPVAEAILEAVDENRWPGFHAHHGSEIGSFVSDTTVLASLAADEIVAVKPGSRRKKASFDMPGWHVEIHRADKGGWRRVSVSEPKAIDLQDFDQRPEHVAALFGTAPLQRLGTVRETLLRVGVESGRSGGLFEIDIARRAVVTEEERFDDAGFKLAERTITIRAPAGRHTLDGAEVDRDIGVIADHLAGLFGTALSAPLAGDCPAGLTAR